MNTENWKIIEDTVTNALAFEGKEREDFINAQCEKFPDLKDEFKSLLHNENEADDFFDSPAAVQFASIIDDKKEVTSVGQKIGNYQIIKELGTGGMGAVYLAKRIDGKLDQKVAIKMLRREFNTSDIRQRFENEKEIQSTLNHSNIAHLIDAGTTKDSIPFLVMEYIEGENISNYCRSKNLSLNERLKLFNKVCDAVAFAHRNLVIHRDLKPSNIIVTKNGEPKLLDFGISKLLTDKVNQTQTITKMGVMTPEYASPEQAKGESVTTATDIYSLGVILFELLTGKRPFEDDFRNNGDVFKVILEKEPMKPSDILTESQTFERSELKRKSEISVLDKSDDEAQTRILEERNTKEFEKQTIPHFATNPKYLRGDLDNIILKALRKEPERRYQTVEQFSGDIWRHLDGMPVSARPATFIYRASKFIKRNKVGVFASGFILLAIVGGLITTLWQAKRAERRFNDVRELANTFLFEVDPKIEKLEGSIEARELLVKRGLEYLNKLSTEASGDYDLQIELANAYEKIGNIQGHPFQANIGDTEGALVSYEKSQEIRKKLITERNDLDVKISLAKNYKLYGDLQQRTNDIEKIDESYNEAKDLWEAILKEYSNNFDAKFGLLEVLRQQAFVMFFQKGDTKSALENGKEVLKKFEKISKEHPNNLDVKSRIAAMHSFIGQMTSWETEREEAVSYFEKAIEIVEEATKKEPENRLYKRDLMLPIVLLGKNYSWSGEFDKAFLHLNRAVKISEEIAAKDPNNFRAKRDLGNVYFLLGDAYTLKGEKTNPIENGKKALEQYNKTLEIRKGIEHEDKRNKLVKFDIANTYSRIGSASLIAKDFETAVKSYAKALENNEQFSKESPKNFQFTRRIAVESKNLAETYFEISKSKDAKQNCIKASKNAKRSIEVFEKLKSLNKFEKMDEGLFKDAQKIINECNN